MNCAEKYWLVMYVINNLTLVLSLIDRSLVHTFNNTYFFSAREIWNITRAMTFTNTFNFSVVLYNISIPSQYRHFFSVSIPLMHMFTCICAPTDVPLVTEYSLLSLLFREGGHLSKVQVKLNSIIIQDQWNFFFFLVVVPMVFW